MELDQDWVPYSQEASLYIRPTFIGTEVGLEAGPEPAPPTQTLPVATS